MTHKINAILWFVVLFSALLASLAFSWNLLSRQDYGYHWLYDLYAIEQHIDKYAPQNHYILGLDGVGRSDHERMFGEIVHAIHHQGQGLEGIEFLHRGETVRLLRQPEVVHLQDVANLVDFFQLLGLVSTLIVVLLGSWLIISGSQPKWRQQLGILLGLVLVCTALVLIIGAKAVFYQFHVWVFPPEHEWFFYYQDSLMTTLMKAPHIFGAIAAAILVGGLLIFVLMSYGLKQLAQQRASRAQS